VTAGLDGKRVIVCAGSGGVGKTTTAAALAMGLAAAGQRVAVVTIDPARRLSDALGLQELGNEPRLVDPARFAGHGIEMRGELWAMMLDAEQTFDELIELLAPDRRTRDEVLSNRIYQHLSGAVAGSHEFTAVAKVYELDRSGRFDVLVLDTPPSRNALDFLDAPERLIGFFEGRALRTLLAPTGLAARVLGRAASPILGILRRLTGVELLDDLAAFFRALGGLIDGFRERAEGVQALLRERTTTFLIVTSPEREPVEEAIFFAGRLRDAGMPFGGLVVNRVHAADGPLDGAALEASLDDPALGAKVAEAYAEERTLAGRDAASIQRLLRRTGEADATIVPELDGDVHDVDGLARVHEHLFGAARD
jgi:anion-transporting  ArsA/GET3 family ATPase